MLLRRAQRDLGFRQNLKLEYPAGLQEETFLAANFSIARTLIWMHTRLS